MSAEAKFQQAIGALAVMSDLPPRKIAQLLREAAYSIEHSIPGDSGREPGYYWVKWGDTDWQVGWWYPAGQCWYLPNDTKDWPDRSFAEVGERITRDAKRRFGR